jgi:hypothetical protein
MATKQEIMAALTAQKEKSKNKGSASSGGDNASYAFWNIDVGDMATVRFLPDGDTANTFFWVKREVIKMPFDGVEGGDYPTTKAVTVTVPCVEMWGDSCPILTATRPWWKDPAKEATARQYWKKKSFIFQGFVVNSPFEEQNLPENPIRRFVINPSIFEIIEKSLMDPEMEDMPTDYVGGVDFRIRKTKKGDYSNYSTSEWSRKTRSLGEDELTAIEQHGLFNLSDYLGRRPDSTELAAIKAMFDDSVAGRPFDVASFGQYYRPYGDRDNDGGTATPAARTQAAAAAAPSERSETRSEVRESAAETAVEPTVAASAATANAHEILERIKNRTMNKGA